MFADRFIRHILSTDVCWRYESEINGQTDIELTACEIVGNGILDIVYIGDPVIGCDVGDVEQVEHIESEPYTLEVTLESVAALTFLEWGEKCVGEADIHALVRRHAEVSFVAARTWSCGW